MTKKSKVKTTKESNQPSNAGAVRDTIIPAIRHVGPTLEAEPDYVEPPSTGYSTPEAQIAAEGIGAASEIRGISDEPLTGIEPESLKTRLPGDTSSDPHTDVGADNATALQHRGEKRNPSHRAA
ncbi:MAG TPA: hypothetical protein VGF96_00055 [Terracidiphilus sp.]|jgi:hypothetical protein